VPAAQSEPVARKNRQRQHSAAQTHEQEKVEHVVEANKHYRGANELCVATTKSAPPKEQECDCEHRCARYQGMTCRYWIISEYHSRQAEYGDGRREGIGDAPRPHIAIGDGDEDPDRYSHDYCLHGFTRS